MCMDHMSTKSGTWTWASLNVWAFIYFFLLLRGDDVILPILKKTKTTYDTSCVCLESNHYKSGFYYLKIYFSIYFLLKTHNKYP